MVNLAKSYLAIAVTAIASLSISVVAHADTVNARCDVYPAGEDRATSSGPCTFSQRQGVVGIQLQNGQRYDLIPVGDQPGNYIDQNGNAAYRQSGLGDQGQIYRLANESIYVYWDSSPYGSSSGDSVPTAPVASNPNYATLSAADTNSRINVRSEPTIHSSSPHYGVVGDRVEIIRCVQDTDTQGSDLNWCNVRFPASGATGWIRSDFIIFSDDGE